jgi:hypothetical protein
VLYVLYLFKELIVFLKISVVHVPVFSVPLYQPIFGFVLRLLRDLGGRRLRAGGEEVFPRELAWVSTGVSVRVWALLVITDPVAFGSPFFFDFFLVEESPFSWFS